MSKYGFEVVLFQDKTTLWDKLKRFYTEALAIGEPALRIDADVIPNKNVKHFTNMFGWTCAWGWDWYKQDQGTISIHLMNQTTMQLALNRIEEAKNEVRPETYLWRCPEINGMTGNDNSDMYGMHGYGQADQRGRIKHLKHLRNQEYDWELVEKIEAL